MATQHLGAADSAHKQTAGTGGHALRNNVVSHIGT